MEIHSERKKRLSLSLLFKIIKDTVWGFIDDSVMRLSASLAYATLFSIYNPQIEMFARFKMKSSFHKTKRII